MARKLTEIADKLTEMADKLTPRRHSARALAKAEKLYRRAFRLGSDTAAENLAATYQNLGRYRDAVRWYRRAEAAGSPTASLEIARAELYGTGTRRDAHSAFVRLQRLATQRLGWNNWLRVEAMHRIRRLFPRKRSRLTTGSSGRASR